MFTSFFYLSFLSIWCLGSLKIRQSQSLNFFKIFMLIFAYLHFFLLLFYWEYFLTFANYNFYIFVSQDQFFLYFNTFPLDIFFIFLTSQTLSSLTIQFPFLFLLLLQFDTNSNSNFLFGTIREILSKNNIDITLFPDGNYFSNFLLGEPFFIFDPLNLCFLLLTAFIIPFCFLSIFESIFINIRIYTILFLFLSIGVQLSFLTFNLFYFYFFFEIILIPMFFLIGLWGSSNRRTLAAMYFFFFTLSGSILLIIAIMLLSFEVESLFIGDLLIVTNSSYIFVADIDQLYLNDLVYKMENQLEYHLQLIYWWLFFLPFAVKIPMFPFHIWLPEAHVEAPTSGSMFLAAILLKVGAYGFIRYLIPLFPHATYYYQPIFFTLALISIFYSSFTALRQIDIKRIIAYSSIAHMNFAILGLFILNFHGFFGSLLIFIGHGFISAALFFLVGIIYDRYKTRLLFYYSGLILVMPLYGTFFFFFSLGNVAFPGTVNFIGELLILFSLINSNFTIFLFSGFSLLFSLFFTFWLYTRITLVF